MRTVFHVSGADCLQMPLRVLNLFAQFDVSPDRLSLERRDDTYDLIVLHSGADGRIALLAEKLRAMPLVDAVRLERLLRQEGTSRHPEIGHRF